MSSTVQSSAGQLNSTGNLFQTIYWVCFSNFIESSSSSSSGDEEEEQYHDGWDDNLMGDEADRERLEKMTEKEREQEIFNRVEKREALKTRFEIERKLRLAKKKEKKKKREREKQNLEKEGIALRKKERKRHIEEKKAKALDDLKAKRSEKRDKKAAESLMEPKEPQLKASEVFSDDEDEDEQEESKSSSGEGSYQESDEEYVNGPSMLICLS